MINFYFASLDVVESSVIDCFQLDRVNCDNFKIEN